MAKAEFTTDGYDTPSEAEQVKLEAEARKTRLKTMTRGEKFEMLQDLVLNSYIESLENGELKPMELAPIVTLLKNNKVIQEKAAEETESDVIDGIMKEDKKK